MQRTDLSLAVLQLKALGIENIVRFEFPSAPPAKNLVIKTSRGPLLIFHETKLVKKIRRHARLQIIIIIGVFTVFYRSLRWNYFTRLAPSTIEAS